ncbi:MAG: flagellar hook-basal body complex protein [Campylobacterales bacterium]
MNMTLYNGVSGIKTHQFGLDSWSNNVSNVNTNGYRQNLPEFDTLFSKHMEYINSNSIVSSDVGHGATVGANPIDTREGSLKKSDASPFNMALNGNGWFTVGKSKDGEFNLADPTVDQTINTYFSRNGEFSRDGEGYIVNADGQYLYGIDLGKIAENGVFNSTGGGEADLAGLTGTTVGPIRVPKDVYYRPVITTEADVATNLNKNGTSISVSEYTEGEDGYDAEKFNAIDFGALRGESGQKLFDANDKSITIQGYDEDGEPIEPAETLEYGTDFTTIGELMSAISASTGATMELDEKTGCNVLFEGTGGEDPVEYSFSGAIAEALNLPAAKADISGDEPISTSPTLQIPTLRAAQDVYDESGKKMIMNTNYYLTNLGEDGADTWATATSLYDATGKNIISTETQEGTLTFPANSEDGGGDGDGDGEDGEDGEGATQITPPTYEGATSVAYDGGNIEFDLTQSGEVVTTNKAYMSSQIMAKQQDGSPEGRLADFIIDDNGIINLSFTNGEYEAMGRVGMAQFVNDQGLAKLGGNLFQMQQQSFNGGEFTAISGQPIVMWGEDGNLKNSSVLQGMVETSNVDLTVALTELIVMQRGYSANAKSVTTGDEMLKEAIGLKR